MEDLSEINKSTEEINDSCDSKETKGEFEQINKTLETQEIQKIIEINVDSLTRINRLIHEYAHFDCVHLEEKTLVLQKKLGGQHAQEAIQYLREGNFSKWIEKLLVYYDKTYQYSVEKNTHRSTHMDFQWANQKECINTIISKI